MLSCEWCNLLYEMAKKAVEWEGILQHFATQHLLKIYKLFVELIILY